MILPEFGYGGAEKSFSALSVELSKIYKIKIVVFNLLQAPIYPIGGEVLSLEIFSSNNWITKLIRFYKKVIRLRKIKKQFKPHVSISFLEGADYINILSSQKEKTIISIRGSKMYDQNISGFSGHIRKRILLPLLYKKATKIVTLSQGIKQEILTTNKKSVESKITTIYNFIDRDKVNNLAKEPLSKSWAHFFEDHRILIFSGRLSIEKGLHLFLPIYSELTRRLDDIRLIIVGEGEYLASLQNICENLKLSYGFYIDQKVSDSNMKVLFLGYQPNPFKWISYASIFVSSSIHEGFGNSILEALICGVPVIASDCPYGPREILTNIPYSKQISYPFTTDVGILLPLISVDNNVMQTWLDTMYNTLEMPSNKQVDSVCLNILIDKFDKKAYIKNWHNLIAKLY